MELTQKQKKVVTSFWLKGFFTDEEIARIALWSARMDIHIADAAIVTGNCLDIMYDTHVSAEERSIRMKEIIDIISLYDRKPPISEERS